MGKRRMRVKANGDQRRSVVAAISDLDSDTASLPLVKETTDTCYYRYYQIVPVKEWVVPQPQPQPHPLAGVRCVRQEVDMGTPTRIYNANSSLPPQTLEHFRITVTAEFIASSTEAYLRLKEFLDSLRG